METKNYGIFSNEEWPECRLNAETKAAIKGYDTLLCLNEIGRFSGRSKSGVWCVGITSEYYRIANFINYENNHNRKVIMWSENKGLALQLLKQIKELGIKTHMNLDSTRGLCHSTSLQSFHGILKDNALLSYNELIKQEKAVNTVRFELREPEDFLDYIDFCSCESISSEIVVASRQFGKINDDDNFKYKPGVRIYFDTDELQNVQGACMDGLHTFRVYKKLSLDHAKAFVFATTSSLEIIRKERNISNKIKEKMFSLDGEDYWTPGEFVDKANELIYTQCT